MEVIKLFDSDRQNYWIEQIGKCDWDSGQLLYRLLSCGEYLQFVGEGSDVLLLTDGDELVSFCTFAKYDDIQPTDLSPWMGFVFTFPEYRGQHCVARLFEKAIQLSKEANIPEFYISTTHVGLYEKYGCEFKMHEIDISNEPTRVYVKKVQYSSWNYCKS